jgi:CheY-like chemotaxis protein
LQLLTLAGTSVEVVPVAEDVAFRANRARLEHIIVSLVLTANQALLGGKFQLTFERRVVEAGDTSLGGSSYVVLGIECRPAARSAPQVNGASVKERLANSSELLSELLATMSGQLTHISESEGATRFEVHLPIAAASTSSTKAVTPGVARHGGTILVVEDDAAIRLAMSRTLVNAGHTVLEAGDGQAAQELLAKVGQTVDLVVSDVVLPRGGGPDLFAWVKATSPNTAFLLISGREREGASKASELGVGFLGKPFYPAEFLAAVHGVMSMSETDTPRLNPTPERPVVVVVDDDPDIRESFERLLSECDFETLVAKSGLHALQILSERHVDAVITDQFMPGLDGVGLLELVGERFPTCTRILCTGHPASDIVISAVNRGRVHRVLTKTMHAVALRDEIERAVVEASLNRTRVAER